MMSIREDSEARKKGRRVTLKPVAGEEGKTGPYVAYFPSGLPEVESALSNEEEDGEGRTGLAFSTFHNAVARKRKQQLLVASCGNVDYVGSSFQGESATVQPCRYMMGVLDKETKTVRLVPIAADRIFRMEARVRGLDYDDAVAMQDAEGPETQQQDTAEELYLKRRKLTDTFGGRKSKLAVQALDRGAVKEGKIVAPEAIGNIIMAAGKEAGPANVAAPHTERNVPPHNLEATEAADVYPLEGLIPPDEWDCLDASPLVRAAKKWPKRREELRKSGDYPDFILSKVPGIIIEGDKDKSGRLKRARMLLYLSYMLKFHRATIFPEKSTARNFAEALAATLCIPEVILNGFLERFAERSGSHTSNRMAYGKPKKLRELMIAYILMLVLRVDGFSSNPLDIATELRIDARQVVLHYRELGCQVDVVRSRKSEGASSAGAGPKYRAWLPVPLQFPIIKAPVRNKQG